MSKFTPSVFFNNTKLILVDEISHLGHILTYNLNDKQDIIRVAGKQIPFFASFVLLTLP